MSYNYDAYVNAKISVEDAHDIARQVEAEAFAGQVVEVGEQPVIITEAVGVPTEADCPRCGATVVYATSSRHCPKCGYHEGCCG